MPAPSSWLPAPASGIPSRPVARLGQLDCDALRREQVGEPAADLVALGGGVGREHAVRDGGLDAGIARMSGPARGVLPGLLQAVHERLALRSAGTAEPARP